MVVGMSPTPSISTADRLVLRGPFGRTGKGLAAGAAGATGVAGAAPAGLALPALWALAAASCWWNQARTLARLRAEARNPPSIASQSRLGPPLRPVMISTISPLPSGWFRGAMRPLTRAPR